MRRHLLRTLRRGFGLQQPVASGQKSRTEMNIHNQKAEALLQESVSLKELKQRVPATDSGQVEAMVRLEESLDLPYYLHGVQQVPDKKVASHN